MGLNKPVDFTTAKLLKEKGYDEPTLLCYDKCDMLSSYVETVFKPKNYNTSGYVKSAPTITEVVMWLYEKHGIWIRVTPKPYSHFLTHWRWEHMSTDYSTRNCGWEKVKDYMTPTEAYEAAIIYTLKNLI